MICANCTTVTETAFCPTCGQKLDLHRITVGHIAHEGFHSVTHADKGFLLLTKGLLTRPGFIAKEYIEGKRKRYFNPLSFLVLSSALMAYFGTISGYMERLTSAGPNRPAGRQPNEVWKEVFHIASSNGKWLTLLLMAPLFALLSWMFFRKKYNYAENFVLHAFIFGEAALIRILIFIPLSLLAPQYFGIINLGVYEIIYLTFLIVAYKQFFQQHLALTILKAIAIRVLFVVLFWALIYGYVVLKHLVL
jgi:hypothetical protein